MMFIRNVISALILLVVVVNVSGQTVIWTDAGKVYNNIDMAKVDNYTNIDISDCSSIKFSMSYSFNLPWPGSGNMEPSSECINNGGCAGDPLYPSADGCASCWDFMYIELLIDGVVVYTELIGGPNETRQSGTVNWIVCTNGSANWAHVRVTNQNWAADETNTFSNLQIECWNGLPEANVNTPACENQNITLTGTIGNQSDADSWLWTVNGTGTIASPTNLTTMVSNASTGDTYTLTVTDNNNCTATDQVTVTIMPAQDAMFSFADYCAGASNGPTNIITPGGTFVFNPPATNGETINQTTGQISGGVGGSTYSVQYTSPGPCPGIHTESVTVIAAETPTFNQIPPICTGGSFTLPTSSQNGINGTWSPAPNFNATTTYTFTPNPVDFPCALSTQMTVTVNSSPIVNITGNTTGCNSVTLTASGGGPGGSYSWSGGSSPSSATNTFTSSGTYVVTVTDGNGCTATGSATVTVNQGPVGMLSGSGVLCPGQCTTFSFTFTSGSEPFTVNLTANPPGFNLPPVPGITAASTFTVCYQGGGFVPTWNQGTLTLTIPTIFSGTGGISLTGISDGSGCPGMASGSFNLTLTNAPPIQNAGPLTECANMDGEAIFNLTSLNGTLTGGNSNLTVNWFEDDAGTDPITNPSNYETGTTTVYVSVSNGGCSSMIIPVELIVEEGEVPFISMVCAESGTDMCTVCADNGLVNLEFTFGDNKSYSVIVRENNSNQNYTGVVSNTQPLVVLANANSVFELLDIIPLNGCPAFNTYGQTVSVMVVEKPDINPVTIPPSCEAVVLPPITGTNLSGNQSYYTGPGGTGTTIPEGTVISSSVTLYLFDSAATNCEDEESVEIIIEPPVIFDPIDNLQGCSQVVLPEITGFNVSPNAVYNTEPDGSGIEYAPGETINFNVKLYVVDPEAAPDCIVNNIDVEVTIFPQPLEPSVQIDCQAGNGTGNVTFSSPQDPNILYSLDGGPFQNSPVFNNVPNGAHILRYKDNVNECERTLSFNVNCDCVKPAFLFVPVHNENVCEGSDFLLEELQFGGTATSVTLSHNGSGVLTPLSSISSPYSISYTPGADDTGKDVLITIVSDDPDGFGPCEPETRSILLKIRNKPDVLISGQDTVCTGGTITLTAVGATSYIWSDNGGNNKVATYTNIIKKDTFSVTGVDVFGCRDTAYQEITVKGFTAGRDTTVFFCKSAPAIVNLNNYLEAKAEKDGKWYAGTNEIINPANYQVTDLPVGSNNLLYVIDDAECGSDTAVLLVQIRDFNNAGSDYSRNLCADAEIFDFTSGLGIFDAGGSWIQRSGTQLSMTNPAVVNIGALMPGSYNFLYVIPDNGCAPDSAFVTLTLKSPPDAGPDVSASSCIGSTIDLFSLINATDKSGLIVNPSGHPGLSGTLLNTAGLNPGNYVFAYVVGSLECGPDTSLIRLTLDAELNPGADYSGSYCPGAPLNLKSFTDNQADAGGTFYLGITEITSGIFSTSPGQGTLVFRYVVGDGVNCPEREALLTFTEQKAPDITISGLSQICEGRCQDVEIRASVTLNGTIWLRLKGQQSSSSFPWTGPVSSDKLTFKICAGSSGPYNFGNLPPDDTYTISIDSFTSEGCLFKSSSFLSFSTSSSVKKSLNPVICKGETFVLGSDTYSASNPSGITKLFAVPGTGCDTLVTVNLTFFPDATGDYKADFCNEDAVVSIGNQTFSKTRPSGIAILQGAAVNGCDSTVNVSLTFTNMVSEGTFSFTTCDPLYVFTAGNTTFSKANPEGEVLLKGVAAMGCDSLLKVKLTYTVFTADIDVRDGCKDEASTLIVKSASLPGPYSVQLNDKPSGNATVIPFEADILPGNYTVVLVTTEGCSSVPVQLMVSQNTGPDVDLIQTTDANGVTQILVNVAPNAIYDLQWTPAAGLSCTDCLAPLATPAMTTTYVLRYAYGNDCVDSTEITIIRVSDEIVISNIFTPDGDGSNDYFYVQLPDNSDGIVKSMRIFDRWGNSVFIAENITPNTPEAGWGGDFSGTELQPGVFVYTIEIQLNGEANARILYGNVTLMK